MGLTFVSVVALVLALVLCALAFLATPPGGRLLRALVVEKANAAIDGTLDVRGLSLRGGHLRLEGVELRDPKGELVASVSGLEVRLRLLALVRRRIDVALVRLDAPKLLLTMDESGSNLQRALAARNPAPAPAKESEQGQGSSVGLEVESLEIDRGVIDFVDRSAEAPRHVHLEELATRGSARIEGSALGARLELAANVAAPFHGPLHLRLEATGAGERKDARLGLELGSARLAATAHVENERTAEVRIESLVVPPELVKAFSPSYPLRAVASLSGEGRRTGEEFSVRLKGEAGSANARVDGTFGGGELRLHGLLIELPGVRLEARGRGSKERLALSGALVAQDLRAFSRSVSELVGPGAPSMKGRGKLEFALGGSAEHPSVEAEGRFPLLAYQQSRVDDLALNVNVPDLKAPTGKARVTVRTLAIAPAKVFRAVYLKFDGEGQELTLDAAVHGYADLSLRALGTRAPDGSGGTLRALSVRYPEARWSLEAPVRVESRGDSVMVSPFTLRSGPQAVSGRLLARGTKLDASLALRALALGRLPRALVDPALALGGVLDLRVRLRGSRSHPEAQARVDLRNGAFEKYRGVQLHLDASYARDQAKGSLAAEGEGIRLTGAFDVPVKALRHGWRKPVKVELRMAELRLDQVLRNLGLEPPVSGLVSAEASLRGTADDPRLAVALSGHRLLVKQVAISELAVVAKSADDGRLGARVDLVMEGRKSFVELETPFTLGGVIRNPPTQDALMAAELRLEADVREVPLKLLSEAGLVSHPLGGSLSARAHVSGTGRSPRGELSVSGTRLATRGVEPLDALVRLTLGDELHAEVRAGRDRADILTARARVGADPSRLRGTDRLAQVPFQLEVNVGPLSLSELQAAATRPTDVDPAQRPPRVRGTLTGRLASSGTLRDPRAEMRMRMEGVGAEGTPDGQVTVTFDYANAKETLDLLVTSQNGGALHAVASTNLDLSYPALSRPLQLDTVPVNATLQAKDLDPAFLSGMTGAVEKLGGRLYADAHVGGSLRSPTVKGRLEWKDGLLSTPESGELTHIHLLASGDADRIELEELTARSGGGTAKLSALATRTAEKTFTLHASANLEKFPVMSQGQVAATLSVRSTADGVVSPTDVTIRNLAVPEAHVVLPDVGGKNLQKLDDPPDVVLTVNGRPVRRASTTVAATGASAGTGVGASEDAGTGSAGSGKASTQVTVTVNAPRNLWIQGNDVNTELGLSDGFRLEYASEPKIFGDVNVLRGRLDVFGRRFDLQRDSKVSFSGPPMAPGLDVTANYKNELEQVTVHLKIAGEPGKLQLQPTSDPPLSETEIYTLLATGHTSLQRGTGSTTSISGEATSILGSLAASQLKKTLSSKLPLDVLSIEAGSGGLAGTKLEAGTYVNERFYVGFTGRIGADPTRGENSNQVDLEYQLSKRWSVDGNYGDARAGEASVNWRKEY